MAMDLNTFCNKHDYRKYLREPFILGDRTVASNGHVMLSVPRCVDMEPGEPVPGGICESIRGILNELHDREFSQLPEITLPEPINCPACKGTGHAKKTECPECEGEGEALAETNYNEYEVQCKTCGGDGFVLSCVENEDEECENCDGTGKTYGPCAHVIVDGIAINPNYLNLIKDEPGLEISANRGKNMLYFRAGDQEGAIMGMRV